MMDHPTPELIFLTYSAPGGTDPATLNTTKHLSLHEDSLRPAEFLNDIIIDSSGRLAVVSCYTGKLKFIVLRNGGYSNDFDVRYVRSLEFVPS
jgi:DNA damage-binding protein 1